MKANRPKEAYTIRGPFWRDDARARLKAFLPELVLSIVAASCTVAAMVYRDNTSFVQIILFAVISQVFVQSLLYALIYLTNEPAMASMLGLFGIMLVAMLPNMTISGRPIGPLTEFATFDFYLFLSLGMTLFYLARLRGTLAYILMTEAFLGSETFDAGSPVMFMHFISMTAYLALFIVRSSSSRVTITSDTPSQHEPSEDTARRHVSPAAQAMLLAAAVGALSLAASLGFGWQQDWGRKADAPSSLTLTVDTEPKGDSQPVGETTGEGELEGLPIDGLETSPAGDTGTSSQADDGSGGSLGILGVLLAIVVVLALLGLPFAIRLLLRKRIRLSIEREPSPADRAARIYLETLSRLKALGIERSEDETPREFLILYEDKLTRMTDQVGLDPNCWQTITDVYEKARYAELDATEPEIEACWQIYDALPKYARSSLGWFRYLAGPFWQM